MLNTIKVWAKSLAEQFSKPQTYGSELEKYITSHQPQNAGDVDRLAREYDRYQSQSFFTVKGY